MKIILIVILTLFLSKGIYAAEELVHLSEDITVADTQEIFQSMDLREIRKNTEKEFPSYKKYIGGFSVGVIYVNSGTSRLAFKVMLETEESWDREQEFVEFYANKLREQIPGDKLYEHP